VQNCTGCQIKQRAAFKAQAVSKDKADISHSFSMIGGDAKQITLHTIQRIRKSVQQIIEIQFHMLSLSRPQSESIQASVYSIEADFTMDDAALLDMKKDRTGVIGPASAGAAVKSGCFSLAVLLQ
ncbi:MAG: hypothetical protein RR320_05555, partial [Oscillospiraceae bacterium]